MKKGLIFILLIAIIAVGIFFRLNQMNTKSLWLDEGITYYNSASDSSIVDVWDRTAELDQSPPLYYFIMHSYLKLFGENEFGFRLIPLIFGALSIFFLYLLISEIFGMGAGIIASVLLAINPFHIGFSIESRMYVLLSLESLMGLFFLYKALKSRRKDFWWWVFFSISCIMGVYTHNFFFFILLAYFFIFILLVFTTKLWKRKLLLGIFTALIVAISYLPWLPNFLLQLEVERYWMAQNSIFDLYYFYNFANKNLIVFSLLLFSGLIGFLFTFFYTNQKQYKKRFFGMLCLLIFLMIGFGAPLGYSLIVHPILKIRYVVYLVPIFLGLISVGIWALRKINVVVPIILTGLLIYLWMPWQVSAYPIENSEDFRGLVEVVKDKPAPVVAHTPSITHVINFYNDNDFLVYPFPNTDDLREFNFSEDYKSKYRDLIRNFNSFYLVVTHTHENPPGILYIWSDSYCERNEIISISGMNVYYFYQCR